MKAARLIRIPTRMWVLLLAILVALCATDLSGPAMVMADAQDCAGPVCETLIGCGESTQPQNSSGSALHLLAAPASGGLLLVPTIERRSIDRLRARVSGPTHGPPASRAPPAV
jgi:hypothetical protein